MSKPKRIALVIPAYNEERLIVPTLQNVPVQIHKIYVVDDASLDQTTHVVRKMAEADPRIELISHAKNTGPGGAVISGYLKSARDGYDITVVVGGDNQMPLNELSGFLDPLIREEVDYTKGNRFLLWDITREEMPPIRILGNIIITALTKFASGYYKIMDVVDGYTAITRKAIQTIDWSRAWPKYGYPMDFLVRLNAYGFKIKDVPRTPIYLKGERQSQIKGFSYAMKVSPMLVRGFFWRMFFKYLYRDFHPLIFFYLLGMILLPFGILYGCYQLYLVMTGVGISGPRAILCALSTITGLQFLLFAMWFDMEASK